MLLLQRLRWVLLRLRVATMIEASVYGDEADTIMCKDNGGGANCTRSCRVRRMQCSDDRCHNMMMMVKTGVAARRIKTNVMICENDKTEPHDHDA